MTEIGLIPEKKYIDELGNYYDQMSKKIKDELLSMSVENYSEVKAFRIRENINKIIKSLNKTSSKWTDLAVPDTYKNGSKTSKTILEILNADRDPGFNSKLHYFTVKDQSEIAKTDFIKANQSIKMNVETYFYLLKNASDGVNQLQEFDMRDELVIAGLLDEAILEGESRHVISRMIMEHFQEKIGEEQFISLNGRNWNLRKYSNMVARTRLREVQSRSTINMCNQYKNDLVQVSDHATKTPICLPYEGNVYSLNGTTPGYSQLPEPPPFHPNCMHHIAPTSAEILKRKENA